ncbi:hypothetical protein Tco_1085982 [Tanacetum coccineum]
MELCIQGKDHGRIILNSVENDPLIWPTVEQEDDTVRLKTYEELSYEEKLQANCDLKATNIVLQGLPPDVYALVNHHKIAKDIWDRVKLLMQGASLSRQERECKLYDEFDKFSHVKVQVNTKFLNSLPLEWGKFVTDVKLARDLHTSNYDQLYAFLEQHEAHANEARLMHERFPNPLALVANYHPQPSHFKNYHSHVIIPNTNSQLLIPSNLCHINLFPTNGISTRIIHNNTQDEFAIRIVAVLTFLPGDDPIACMNKAMAFLLVVFSPRYPPTNNQLRSSSNLRNQANIQDGKVTVQKVQGRQGKGHIARQCTQSKRRRDATWFKEKVLLVQAQTEGKELDEEHLAFLADPRVADAKAVLMANLSSCDSDVLSAVPYSNTFQNDMMNQSVQELQYSEQTPIVDYPDNEITSDSNVIPYSQYLKENKRLFKILILLHNKIS